VLRARPRAFRQVVHGVEGIETPLVGRQDELKFLQDALLGAIEDREGQVVTISGEAGVGKSRLLYEFQNWIELLPQRVRFFQGKARQEAQGLPYGLLRDMVAFRFQMLDDDRVEEVWRKLETGFGEIFGSGDEGQMRAHILGQLLGYDFSLSPHLKRVINDPEQLRNQGLMYLVEYFKALCERGPVVVFLEDLHWADDSSLDAINRLGELAPHQSFLVVSATRHTLFERRPYWGEGLIYHHFIELEPLSRRESRQLVSEILKLVEETPQSLRDLVVEGGEGNPFYIEELIKMLVESGVIAKGKEHWYVEVERLEQLTVPATLAGVLQARLDSLPTEERVVLQQASVVGRLFWDRVVAYIHAVEAGDGGEERVPEALAALRGRELVYRREDSAFTDAREYLFKHDILREVTYESVLKRLRKAYHALAADWLIVHSGERVGEYRGLIAEHLLLGGRKDQALIYLQEAGEAALASFANPEAEIYFRRALDLSPGEAQQARLLAGMGEALRRQAKREESAQAFRKSIELYRRMDDLDQVAYLYASLSFLLWRIDYLQAWKACQEGLELLEGAPDSRGLAYLLAEAGRTAHFRAEPIERIEALCQRAITMAEKLGEVEVQGDALITQAIQFRDISQSINMLEKVVALTESIGPCETVERAHTDLGYLYDTYIIDINAAIRESNKAAEIARQIGDIDGMFFNLSNVGLSQIEQGNLDSVIEDLEEFLRHSATSPAQVDEFLQFCSSYMLFARGEWWPALEFFRNEQDKRRKGGNLQDIAQGNLALVLIILDLNCFAGLVDLSEAEAVLLENIEIGWSIPESRYLLVVVYARKDRLMEARTQLTVANETIGEQEYNNQKVNRLEAEAELALAEKRWSEAIAALQYRMEIYRAAGFRWRWARDLIRLGHAFHQQDGLGDQERAQETYKQSLEMFTEMGATGYINALKSRLQDLEEKSR
jgi:predicted ATPase